MNRRALAAASIAAFLFAAHAPLARAGSRSGRGNRSGRGAEDPKRAPEPERPSDRRSEVTPSNPARLRELGHGASPESARRDAERWVDKHLASRELGTVAPEEFALGLSKAGAFKVPIALGEDQLLLVAKKSIDESFYSFHDEAVALIELDRYVPTLRPVALGTVRIGDKVHEAMIVPRFAVASKDLQRDKLPPEIRSQKAVVLPRALAELDHIARTLADRHIAIADAQFLMAHDGGVVVFDPLSVLYEGNPDYATVRLLTERSIAAFRSGLIRALGPRKK